MEQNEPAFCSASIALHSVNRGDSREADRQNQSILSIPIDLALHATKCNRLVPNDLPHGAPIRPKQNGKIHERQTSLCARRRPCDRQNERCHRRPGGPPVTSETGHLPHGCRLRENAEVWPRRLSPSVKEQEANANSSLGISNSSFALACYHAYLLAKPHPANRPPRRAYLILQDAHGTQHANLCPPRLSNILMD
jgi:hypothetical protein